MGTHQLISDATRRNWERLSTDTSGRLLSRANKKMSNRLIVPREYFSNQGNIGRVIDIRDYVQACSYEVGDVVYSLAVNMLRSSGIADKAHVVSVLNEYHYRLHDDLLVMDLPTDEFDLLGIIYQCLLTEGDKNVAGAYYTPPEVVAYMLRGVDVSDNRTFLDPCCGTGAFLLSLSVKYPSQLHGIEIDPVAAMIAKVNLLLKYKDCEFVPDIRCADFLADVEADVHYDYIYTNPPWGAYRTPVADIKGITSGETFSLFMVKAFSMLAQRGVMRFLLPESVLNVKSHKDIRLFILDTGSLCRITVYGGRFSGVVTRYVDLCLDKSYASTLVRIDDGREEYDVDISHYRENDNCVFNRWRTEDADVIAHVQACGRYTLSDSVWALGIVTGDNKRKLHNEWAEGLEAIYTGKEIQPYRLKTPCRFIKYDRTQFQQVAKDEIYRAGEKLVYKFISDKLTFAYDNTGALFLNSANILVPRIPGMNIKTVMAFLNSRLFKRLYGKMFSEIKILKGNLLQLPFPAIDAETDRRIAYCVERILWGDDTCREEVEQMVYRSYGLTAQQIEYIEQS